MSKCYFCGEETKGRKFVGKNFLTREREKFDICENCCVTDLEEFEHEEHLTKVGKEKQLKEWISKKRHILEERRSKSDYGPERIYLLGRIEALDELEDVLEGVEGK